MLDVPHFEGMRILRIQVGITADEITVIDKRKERRKIVVCRAMQPPAVAQLDGVLSTDIIGNVRRRKEIEIFAVIYLTRLQELGREVCILTAKAELIRRFPYFVGYDGIRGINVLVIVKVIVETFEGDPLFAVQFRYEKIVRNVAQRVSYAGFELSVFMKRISVICLKEQLPFGFVVVGMLQPIRIT